MAEKQIPTSIATKTPNFYDKGTNAGNGPNSQTFYQIAGQKAAAAKKVFQQFVTPLQLPQGNGRELRYSIFMPSFLRNPYDEASASQIGGEKKFNAEFAAYGYLAQRDIKDVTAETFGTDGRFPNGTTFGNNGKRLLEGEMQGNQTTLSKVILNAFIEKFGESLTYTQEVTMFSEDKMLLQYREDLGGRAGQLYEDLLQLDMLATPTVFYSGVATSLSTLGVGIGEGLPDAVTQKNAIEDSYKVNLDLFNRLERIMIDYRVPRDTEILTGDVKIGTKPIGQCYVGIISSALLNDLRNITRDAKNSSQFVFTEVQEYAGQTTTLEGEVGRLGNFRFVIAEKAMVDRGMGAEVDENYVGRLSHTLCQDGKKRFDVFPILFPGKGAMGSITLIGNSNITWHEKKAGEADKLDHYGAVGFISYHFWYGSMLIRPERMIRVNVLASA